MKRATRTALPPTNTEVSRDEKNQITSSPATPPETVNSTPQKKISRKQLINALNHINFQDSTLTVVFQHTKHPRTLAIAVQPLPCHDQRLTCSWAESVVIDRLMESYQFQRLFVPKGQQLLEVVPELKSISEKQVVFILPEMCFEIGERKIHRHQCKDIAVYLFQNGALFYGELVDYGAFQFRIAIRKAPPQT